MSAAEPCYRADEPRTPSPSHKGRRSEPMEHLSVQTEHTLASQTSATVYTDSDLQRITVDVVMMTPLMAKALRSSAHFERQRPLSLSNIMRLTYEMQQGWFIAGTSITICVLPDASMLIVNGNHTLEAIVSSGISVPLTLVYIQVPDIEAAANIYANMDLQKTRSWQNALQATQGHATYFEGKVVSALGLVSENFSNRGPRNLGRNTSRTARFAMLEEYRHATSVLEPIRTGASYSVGKMLDRVGILSVALVTARYQPSAASEFWSAIVADDGLRTGDPRKTLLRYMANTASKSRDDRINHAKTAAMCWNAAYEGREITMVQSARMSIVRILGTPWHSGTPSAAPISKPTKKAAPVAAPASKLETGIVTSGNGTQAIVARYTRAQPKAARP